ncbi:MAG: preprotein translocase subunit YajC [Bacteroidales bacterium]|jgi:preprotein translocase subunit YajC|nr:preprotein translocase subunit YajC [Bacteroidales bacterium]
MDLLQVFLFAAQSGSSESGKSSGIPMIIFFVLLIFIFYFFMIRPQKKREKEAQVFRNTLQKGDRIVTHSGMHGKISDIQDSTIIIETEGGSKIKIEKAAVAHREKETGN